MCLGTIGRLAETWHEDGARVGRLDDRSVVSLAFLPDASSGDYVLVHVGVPVEVLDAATAREALSLRASALPQEETHG